MKYKQSKLERSLLRFGCKISTKCRFSAFYLGLATAALIAGLTACGETIDRPYRLVMPDLPPAWQQILGDTHWRVEWIDDAGIAQTASLAPSAGLSVTVVNNTTSPVLAYPYWPERNLRPGDLKPAGALFPWDVCGDTLTLSWRGGVDAVFWQELSRAGNTKREATAFNWKRWREAWLDNSFPPAIVCDPWLCDWESVALKVAASGFDKRRIVAVNYPFLALSGEVCQHVWYGTSPFDRGTTAVPGDPLLLPVRPHVSIVFSDTGIIRYSGEGILSSPWE